jgi:copper chaperone CopZ
MTEETTLKIPAIHCDSCVKTVSRTLGALPSVEVTETDPDSKLVRLRFDGSAVNLDRIREALDEIGFSPDV